MITMTRLLAALLLAETALAAGPFTDEQLTARFYYDLGPAEVDVSRYPKQQREEYAVFRKTCSQCHTLARPINAPISARADWKRYLQRMHLRTKTVRGTDIKTKDAAAILDFLAYDSRIRKIEGKAAFAALSADLESAYEEALKERTRRQAASDREKAKPLPPDNSGARPYP